MNILKTLRIALVCATAGAFIGPAIGDSVSPSKAKYLGTPRARTAGSASAAATTAVPTVKANKTYTQASFGTGGVALRNRSTGVIHISGVVGASSAAWIYWSYLYSAVAPPATQAITITRLFPGATAPRVVSGALIATGGDPCWGARGTAVYRAAVPVATVTGNGAYQVTLDPGAVGLTTGEDPWDGNVVFPAAEGASLVVIGKGASNVSLFDKGMSGIEFGSTSLSYNLNLPLALTGQPVLFDSIGADGQLGTSRLATGATPGETVKINGALISGPGGLDSDSDWNGSSGFPLPQLWDDTGHDISSALAAGGLTLGVTINAPQDCLVTVANVVSY